MLRRHFVNVLLSSGILATAASIFYPILKFVIPPETAESAVMSNRNGQLNVHIEKSAHQLGRALFSRIDDVQNARLRTFAARLSILFQIGELRIHREPEDPDFFRRDPGGAHDCRALLV